MDSKFISTTIGDLEDLTSGIKSNVVMEDSIVIHIESAIKGDSTINIKSVVKVNSTMDSQCTTQTRTTDFSITIIRVNSESVDVATISDSECMVSTKDQQVAVNRGVVTNVKGPTDGGST